MYLTLKEATKLFYHAVTQATRTEQRLGKAITFNLPIAIFTEVTGTDLDIYYLSDEEAANIFWTSYVISDKLPTKLQLLEDMETQTDE